MRSAPIGSCLALVCLAMLAIAPPARAHGNGIMRAADAFVAALTSDDLGAFEAVAATRVAGDEWEQVRELMSMSRCIEVHSYRVSVERSNPGEATVALEIDATRLTRGATPQRVAVPAAWVLELACEPDTCRIRSVTRRERVIAQSLLKATPEERERIIRDAPFDEGAIGQALVEVALFPRVPFESDPETQKRRSFELGFFARDLARRAGDRAAEVQCIRLLSVLQRATLQDAVPLAQEGVAVATTSGDPDLMSLATFALGLSRWGNGDRNGAIADLGAAAAFLDRLSDPRTALKALAMKSRIAAEKGDLRESLRSAQQLLDGAIRYGWTEGEGSAGIYLAQIYATLDAPEVMRRYLETAYRTAVEARDLRGQIYALNDLAGIEDSDGENAAGLLRRALELMGPEVSAQDRVAVVSGLVSTLMHAGKLDEADQRMKEALAIARKDGGRATLSYALTVLSELRLAQHRASDALAAADEALHVPAGAKSEVWLGYFPEVAAGRALVRLGRTSEAEAAFRRAIAEVEPMYSQFGIEVLPDARFFAGRLDAYAELAEILGRRGRGGEALRISERMRARVLAAVLGQGKIDASATMTREEREREQALNARLAEVNRALLEKNDAALTAARDAARMELDRFRHELYLSRPTLRLRRPLDGDAIEMPAALADTVLVEYIVLERGVVILSARRGKDGTPIASSTFVPVSERRLKSLTASLVRALEERDAGYRERARTLYDLLLLPVEAHLQSRRKICIIPDGVLWRLPFHTLIDPQGRHVLERKTVFYAPSLRTLALASARRASDPPGQLLAFGDPKLTRKAVADAVAFQRDANTGALPDAQREVRAIRRFYPAGAAKVLIGADASEEAFKRDAANYRVLHIAAHGLFDERAPMYSALLLSSEDDGREDGFLEAREIADLSLHGDIAILSACDTARGRYGAGEGLIGMSWALQVAGCPTAIVSQWKASSAPTARLMIAFHRHLIAGASKSDALRRAALELMHDPRYAHPFYWAPFVLVGAP